MVLTPSSVLASFGQRLETTVSTPGVSSTHLASIPQVCMYMCVPGGWSGSWPMNSTLAFAGSAPLVPPVSVASTQSVRLYEINRVTGCLLNDEIKGSTVVALLTYLICHRR